MFVNGDIYFPVSLFLLFSDSESHSDSNNVGVDVGGYDLSELLPSDKDSKQAMEDIITVGVNQITASLDSDIFKSHGAEGSREQKDQAVEVAKKIKTTAAEMAKGGTGNTTVAPKGNSRFVIFEDHFYK